MTLDDHISATRAAAERTVGAMDAIEAQYSFPADCCPSCACGPEWHALAAKLERQLGWLCAMLAKRGTARDTETVEAIRMGAWP